MENSEKYRLYDHIVAATYMNISRLSKKNIKLNNFNYSNINHKFFLQIAKQVSQIENKKIYIDLSLIKFLIFKINKNNKGIKKLQKENKEEELNIDKILEFERKAFEEKEDIFERIYKEYYERKKK